MISNAVAATHSATRAWRPVAPGRARPRRRVPDQARRDAAQWMLTRFHQDGTLDQEHAAREVSRLFGSHLVYLKPSGAYAIDRKLLRHFTALTGDQTVWSRSQRCWRRREPHDPAGRAAP
jgi:hypothetical protein